MTRRQIDDFGLGPLFTQDPPAPATAPATGAPTLLMLCTANISRSPYAELRARQLLGRRTPWVVASAGVPGTRGRRMDPRMAERAASRGIEAAQCQAHRSRPLDAAALQGASLVLAMERRHRDAVVEDFPAAHRRVVTLDQAALAVEALAPTRWAHGRHRAEDLLGALLAACPPASPGGDVPDPWGQPEAVAREAADMIDTRLVTLLTLLGHVAPALDSVRPGRARRAALTPRRTQKGASAQ